MFRRFRKLSKERAYKHSILQFLQRVTTTSSADACHPRPWEGVCGVIICWGRTNSTTDLPSTRRLAESIRFHAIVDNISFFCSQVTSPVGSWVSLHLAQIRGNKIFAVRVENRKLPGNVIVYMVYFSGRNIVVVQLLCYNLSLANSLCSFACFEEESTWQLLVLIF